MTDKHDRKHEYKHNHKHDQKQDHEEHNAKHHPTDHHYPGQPIADTSGPEEKSDKSSPDVEEKGGHKGHHKEHGKHK